MTMFSSYSNPMNASACGAEASFSCAHTARLALDAVLASIFVICLLGRITLSVLLTLAVLVRLPLRSLTALPLQSPLS